jgi:hypothetical protein
MIEGPIDDAVKFMKKALIVAFLVVFVMGFSLAYWLK